MFWRVITGIAPAPVPRDLDLSLPLNSSDLEVLIVILFLVHILFVNLMVGGSILTVFFEIVGRVSSKYDLLARRIGETITVNKSLAVVLGVAPLLCINLLYTTYFYSANALTGYAWISIVPLVILAFLLTYWHKYSWDSFTGSQKAFHIGIGVTAMLLFLFIPLIFLANINLMLFPQKWPEMRGFFSSLQLGNVFPRYFHFLTASIALTGLFLAGWFGRKKYPLAEKVPGFTKPGLRRDFYRVAFWVTAGQLFFGPLLLLTLPSAGMSVTLLIIVSAGILLAALVLFLLWSEIRRDDATIGHRFGWIVVSFSVLVVIMATGRHVYREGAVSPHREMVRARTAKFRSVELATQMRIAAGLGAGEAMAAGPTGASVFKNCAACHAINKVLAAPAITEIYSIYKGDPQGIVAWATSPGKKRPQFAPMPSFAHLGEDKLELVADYMLELGAEATQQSAGESPS
jgi:cytochrome c